MQELTLSLGACAPPQTDRLMKVHHWLFLPRSTFCFTVVTVSEVVSTHTRTHTKHGLSHDRELRWKMEKKNDDTVGQKAVPHTPRVTTKSLG